MMPSFRRFQIVDGYILKTFLRAFLTIFTLFAVIAFVIVLFNDLENIQEQNIPFGTGFAFILLSLPHQIVFATPIVVVLSVIFGIGDLVRHREMLMLHVAGYSPLRLAIPLSAALVTIIALMFLVNEYISAPLSARAEQLWQARIHGDEEGFIGSQSIWLHGKGDRVYQASEYHPHSNRIRGLMILEFDGPRNTVSARLNAEEAVWDSSAGGWLLKHVVAHRILDDGSLKREHYDSQMYAFEYSPKDFARNTQKPEQMSYSDLRKLVKSVRDAGEDPRIYLPDLRIKEAFPFAIFFLGMLAYSIVVRMSSGARAAGIGLGLLSVIVYFLILSLGKSFAVQGALSPALGAWGPNLLCLIPTLYFFHRMKQEI